MNFLTLQSLMACFFGAGIMFWSYSSGRVGARGFPESASDPMPVPLRAIAFICGFLISGHGVWHLLSGAFVVRR